MSEVIVKSRRRLTVEGTPIYRPTKYPFEMEGSGGYVIQTKCFTDEALTVDECLVCSGFVEDTKTADETEDPLSAWIFDSCEDAVKYARKHCALVEGDDGNIYPRVLKVRVSMIVEGVAFESVARDIEGCAKLEGVA